MLRNAYKSSVEILAKYSGWTQDVRQSWFSKCTNRPNSKHHASLHYPTDQRAVPLSFEPSPGMAQCHCVVICGYPTTLSTIGRPSRVSPSSPGSDGARELKMRYTSN